MALYDVNEFLNEVSIIILVHFTSFPYRCGWLLVTRSHPISVSLPYAQVCFFGTSSVIFFCAFSGPTFFWVEGRDEGWDKRLLNNVFLLWVRLCKVFTQFSFMAFSFSVLGTWPKRRS